LESGGQFGSTFNGLPPLCTVGAAELDPPASGNTALFSTAIEFGVFSSPLPDVAAGDVVQAVSGLASDVPVDWAAAVCGRQKSAIADADISAARVQLQILDKVNASQDGARPKEGVLPRHVNYRNDEVTERYIVFTRS